LRQAGSRRNLETGQFARSKDLAYRCLAYL
jgi:hypothetical protein